MIIFGNGDDEGYLGWVRANPDGFVLNIDLPLTKTIYARVHRACCGSLPILTVTGDTFTVNHLKAGSQQAGELYDHSVVLTGLRATPCGRYRPPEC